ncbi:hypothetical protein ACFY00_33205 [Kitasatospora sp. NPDC001540]|uniref:hypothetical protein n=1 Tax=Kitasatospora sp. NPDC001540 TaxID=3364014 RepID=UPI00367B55E3
MPKFDEPMNPGRREHRPAWRLRRTVLALLFLGVAMAGVIALLVLGYKVEALVTVIVTAAVEASAALGLRPTPATTEPAGRLR